MYKQDFAYKEAGYLDNAATTQELICVGEAMSDWAKGGRANTGRGLYPLAEKADQELAQSRRKIAEFLGGEKGEVIFFQGATHAANFLALQFAEKKILISEMEHHGNIIPWQIYARDVSWVKITKDGEFSQASLGEGLEKRPDLLSLVHVSNVLGGENDIQDIANMARKSDIPVAIDGTQAVAKLPLALDKSGVDFYFFSGHKCYGPEGIGVLWVSEAMFKNLKPVFGGGGMVSSVSEEGFKLIPGLSSLQPGTLPLEPAVGLLAALEWIEERREELLKHELVLTKQAREIISSYGSLLGKRDGLGPISFNLPGIHPHDVAQIASDRGLALRAGTHCAGPLHQALGVDASARVSFAAYNTEADLELLEKVLRDAKKIFA